MRAPLIPAGLKVGKTHSLRVGFEARRSKNPDVPPGRTEALKRHGFKPSETHVNLICNLDLFFTCVHVCLRGTCACEGRRHGGQRHEMPWHWAGTGASKHTGVLGKSSGPEPPSQLSSSLAFSHLNRNL